MDFLPVAAKALAVKQENGTARIVPAGYVKAIENGTLGSGFEQKFQPANDPYAPMAIAA